MTKFIFLIAFISLAYFHESIASDEFPEHTGSLQRKYLLKAEERSAKRFRGRAAEILEEKSDEKAPSARLNAIETKRLIVAPFYPADLQNFYEKMEQYWVKDIYKGDRERFLKSETKNPFNPQNPDYEEAKRETQTRYSLAQHHDIKITDYGLFLKEGGELIGMYSFQEGSPYVRSHQNSFYTDIVIFPAYQKRGLGQEVLKALTENVIKPVIGTQSNRACKDERGIIGVYPWRKKIEHIYGEILEENESSRKIHERCGWRSYESEKVWGSEYEIYQYPPNYEEDGSISKSTRDEIAEMQALMSSYRSRAGLPF